MRTSVPLELDVTSTESISARIIMSPHPSWSRRASFQTPPSLTVIVTTAASMDGLDGHRPFRDSVRVLHRVRVGLGGRDHDLERHLTADTVLREPATRRNGESTTPSRGARGRRAASAVPMSEIGRTASSATSSAGPSSSSVDTR